MLCPATTTLHTGDREASGGNGLGSDGLTARTWSAVPAAFLVASIPFSYLAAKRVSGVDLRLVGSGTVSGTGLFEVAGFGPLAAVGLVEVGKGAVGPLLAGRDHPVATAFAVAAAVIGHNWSPWLRGAGGRGLSPAIGALYVAAPAAGACLLAGMAGGRLAGQTSAGSLVGLVVAVRAAHRLHGRGGAWAAAGAVAPIIVKRLAGNRPAEAPTCATYLWRLVFDRDNRRSAAFVHPS